VAGRRLLLVFGMATGLVVVGAGLARAATPDPASESAFVTRSQNERTTRGLSTLSIASDLIAIARQHSADMASQHRIYDDPNMHNEVQNWQAMGDNVGAGPSVDAVHQAFMNSPGHRANILNPVFTDIGVGVVWSGNTLFVTEIFRQPWPAPAASPPRADPPPPPPPPASPPPAPATRLRPRAAVLPPPPTTAPPTTVPPASTTTTLPTLIASIAASWQPSPLAVAAPPLPFHRPPPLPTSAIAVGLSLLAADCVALARLTVRRPS
jgi:hypothetical protein